MVTEDDLIAALMSDATAGNPHGAKTMRELVALTGMGRDRVGRRLHELHAIGQLGVTTVQIVALDGRVMPRVAYFLRR